jgi:hypothetical protein
MGGGKGYTEAGESAAESQFKKVRGMIQECRGGGGVPCLI